MNRAASASEMTLRPDRETAYRVLHSWYSQTCPKGRDHLVSYCNFFEFAKRRAFTAYYCLYPGCNDFKGMYG